MKFHRYIWVEWPLRLYVALMISVYALGKLAGGQFHIDPLPAHLAQQTLQELSSFDLAWRFFGYSKVYIWFIGLSQLVGAALLLHRKTALIGVFILLPILLNIIVVDLTFHVPGAATSNAILYTLFLFTLLWFDRKRLVKSFRQLTAKEDFNVSFSFVGRWLIGLFMATILFGLTTAIGQWFASALDK